MGQKFFLDNPQLIGKFQTFKMFLYMYWNTTNASIHLFVVFYLSVIASLELHYLVNCSLGLFCSVIISIGFVTSMQVRNICSLVLPLFFSRSGKTYLWALIVSLLIAGKCKQMSCKLFRHFIYFCNIVKRLL